MAATDNKPVDDSGSPTAYGWYVTAIMMGTYLLSYMDRKVPFILVESIKADLKLSDTQVGLLTGAIFAATYAVAGIPLALLADRKSRKNLMGWAVLFWSVLTACGGLATNFITLALSRAGVAIGEAVCMPAAHSIIADYFPINRRSRAIALFAVGGPLGALIGLALGGWINQMSSWRMAMLLLGLPGVLLALVVFFTIKEPPRRIETRHVGDQPSLADTLRTIMGCPPLLLLMIGMSLCGMSSMALQTFAPAFIIRSWGLGTAEVGLIYGLAFGIAGIAGSMLGGVLGDHFRRTTHDGGLSRLAIAFTIGATILILGILSGSYLLFLLSVFIFQINYNVGAAPSFVTIQSLVSNRIHAVTTAITLFGVSGIGLSVGPLIVGMVSDALAPMGKATALGIALICAIVPHIIGAGFYLLAARSLRTSGHFETPPLPAGA